MNISLGKDSISGNDFSVDSSKHINIEGMSGMGISTLLVNFFIESIRRGNGGLFIDPHGDAADQIAKLLPNSGDFIWIDSRASLVPPFSPVHSIRRKNSSWARNLSLPHSNYWPAQNSGGNKSLKSLVS
jgi:hypothetical protein